jgi:AcrR family transcriptional regulator
MRNETASRKERERSRHRQEILDKALGLFGEKGFNAVSMQEIAAASEFAIGTLYNFFPSKEDLYFELLVSCADAAFGLTLPLLDGPEDEPQKVARFIRMHERLAHEHRVALRLYQLERQGRYGPGPKIAAKKQEYDEQMIQKLSAVIEAGVRKGLFNRVDPRVVAKCLTATLESLLLSAAEIPQETDLKSDLKEIETLFFNGLIKETCDADASQSCS